MQAILQMNDVADAWWRWMAPMAWQASLLVAALAVVCLAARRASPRLRYALWCLVLIKLCLPPSLSFVTGVVRWIDRGAAAPSAAMPSSPALEPGETAHSFGEVSGTLPRGAVPHVAVGENHVAAEAGAAAPAVSPAPTLSLRAHLLWAWGAAVIALLGGVVVSYVRLCKCLVAGAVEPTREAAAALAAARRAVGLAREPQLLVTSGARSPMLFGVLRPAVVLPVYAQAAASPQELEPILLHELAHLRRRDLWLNWAQTLLQIVYWPILPIWLANACVRRERELIVDDEVLLCMAGRQRVYGDSLVNVLDRAAPAGLLAPGYLGIVEQPARMQQRLRRILDTKRKLSSRLGWAAALLVVALGLVLIPQAMPAEAPEAAAEAKPDAQRPVAIVLTLRDGREVCWLGLRGDKVESLKRDRSSWDPPQMWKQNAFLLPDQPRSVPPFQKVFVDSKGAAITSRSLWVAAYMEHSKKMLAQLRAAGMDHVKGAFEFEALAKEWEDVHPRMDKLVAATRNCHIAAEFINAIADQDNKGATVELLRTGKASVKLIDVVLRDRWQSLAQCTPYVVALRLPLARVPAVVESLRKVYSLGLSVERIQVGPVADVHSRTVHLNIQGRLGGESKPARGKGANAVEAIRVENAAGDVVWQVYQRPDGLMVVDKTGQRVTRDKMARYRFPTKEEAAAGPPAFPSYFTDRKGTPVRSRPIWVGMYRQRAAKLIRQLQDKHIEAYKRAFMFQTKAMMYENFHPKTPTLRAETVRLHVAAEFINILCSDKSGVRRVDLLRLGRDAVVVEESLKPWLSEKKPQRQPFVLLVSMDFNSMLDLLDALLKSPKLQAKIDRAVPVRVKDGQAGGRDLADVRIVGFMARPPEGP